MSVDPNLIGAGGGFGKYRGLPVDEIAKVFERCTADPSMRSVSAVLRIAREQIEARGALGQYRGLALLATGVSAGAFVFAPFAPASIQGSLLAVKIGVSFAAIALWVGVVTTRDATRAGIAQEHATRNLALDALVKIVQTPGFVVKAVEPAQGRFLRDLMKREKRFEPELILLLNA